MQCQSNQCVMNTRVKPNSLRQIRPTMQNYILCILTASNDQLPVDGKWENVAVSFTLIPIKPLLFP